MNLKELRKELFYKVRPGPGGRQLKYIDARQVQDLLDEVVGIENWQTKYSEYKGNLFCSIGIKVGDEWVWKTDCGSESNMEKEKGESSDAFKRAGVMWGIGRFLYRDEKKEDKLEMQEYIDLIKDEDDLNSLQILWKDIIKHNWSKKQLEWLTSEKDKKKDLLINN